MTKVEEFYAFRVGAMWRFFKTQHFSFWMICCYLFFEYFRPQSIYPAIDILPWAQLFLITSMIGAFLDKSVRWVSSSVNIWLILFAVVIYVSSLNAYFPETSADHFIDFYGWFVIYFLVINIVNTKERFYIFLMVLLFCSAKIAVGTAFNWASRGFSFTTWGLMGPSGYFQNSGELAILMVTLFPLAFYLLKRMRDARIRRWEQGLLLVFTIAPVLTILGASSRGGQIALAAIMLLMFRKGIFRVKALAAITVLVLAVSVLLPDEQKQRFSSMGDDETSQQRILYLKNGWEVMKDHPYIGIGYFNFPEYYELNYRKDLLRDSAELPHNIFIQVGTDAGFIGLGLYLLLMVSGLSIAFRVGKIATEDDLLFSFVGAGLGYGIIGFVVAGQFVTVAYYPFFWISLAFIVALNNVIRKEAEELGRQHRQNNGVPSPVAG